MLKKAMVLEMLLITVLASISCSKGSNSDESFAGVGARPDVLPVMLNKDLPFRYPPALYAKKVQANVTLRVFIDKEGQVAPESTHVVESSGIGSLDSAAVKGSGELRFIPAKTRGEAVPVSILFPVYFRHPDAPPLPGDTILKKPGIGTALNPSPATDDSSHRIGAPANTKELQSTTSAKPKAITKTAPKRSP
jgi:TonB family protein